MKSCALLNIISYIQLISRVKIIIHERELTLFMNYEYDEQYVEQELSKESDWYVKHKEDVSSLWQSINMLLSTNSIQSIYNLCVCFEDIHLVNTFRAVPDIAYCIIGITITMTEFNMKPTDSIFLLNVLSIYELINKINKYKFLLLNIEFNNDKDKAMCNITNDYVNNVIFPAALYYLIQCSSVDSRHIFDEICNYIHDNNYEDKYVQLLDTYNKLAK